VVTTWIGGVVGSRVEDETVVAFAELFDAPNTGDDWEQEFRPWTKSTSGSLTLTIGRQYKLDTVLSLAIEIFPAVP